MEFARLAYSCHYWGRRCAKTDIEGLTNDLMFKVSITRVADFEFAGALGNPSHLRTRRSPTGATEIRCGAGTASLFQDLTIMSFGERKAERVQFGTPITVHIMGIDGTWRRTCELLDVSSTGARLLVEGSLEGLQLKEFFLLLSSTGLVYRRCEMIRINGDELGLQFLKEQKSSNSKRSKQENNVA